MDDGFQHRRLARHFDILTLDATDPFGNGHLIPSGKLREPITSLNRADWIVLTKTDLVTEQVLILLKEKIQKIAPTIPMSETIYRPVGLSPIFPNVGAVCKPPFLLKNKNVGILSAIGNPSAFKQTVEQLGCTVTQTYFKRDHSRYSLQDMEKLVEMEKKKSISCWITTSKDAVKIKPLIHRYSESRTPNLCSNVYELGVELVFTQGEPQLWQIISSL